MLCLLAQSLFQFTIFNRQRCGATFHLFIHQQLYTQQLRNLRRNQTHRHQVITQRPVQTAETIYCQHATHCTVDDDGQGKHRDRTLG
ncbi:hypothetical protein D3C81_1530590 [compost metagenome]